MKKLIILTAIILIFNGISSAQGTFDALRYSQYQYEGTAKSMAMGNAMTSLGGDIYSISINPAASAVYRYSEFSFTPSLSIFNNNVSYLGTDTKKNASQINLSSIGYVTSKQMGRHSAVRNVSFGIAYNVLNNYNNEYIVNGRTNESSWLGATAWQTGGYTEAELSSNGFLNSNAPWASILAWNTFLIDPLGNNEYIGATENDNGQNIYIPGYLQQRYVVRTSGVLSDIVFNAGVNILDKLYLGANLTMQSLYYSENKRYSEVADDPSLFDSGFSEFTHFYNMSTSGVGVNLKFGVIVTPITGLRIATSISTPTWMYLQDEWDESMTAYMSGDSYRLSTPLGSFEYRINTPLRWNFGASYVIGNIGMISADYENINYSNILMKDKYGDGYEFRDENVHIEQNFQNSSIYRVGAEVRPVKGIAFRAGYSYYTNPEINIGSDISYASAGIGFSGGKNFFADLAVQRMLNHEDYFSAYDDYDTILAPTYSLKRSPMKVLLTIGFRF